MAEFKVLIKRSPHGRSYYARSAATGGIVLLYAGEGQHSLPVKQLETGAFGDSVPCGHTAQITQVELLPAAQHRRQNPRRPAVVIV